MGRLRMGLGFLSIEENLELSKWDHVAHTREGMWAPGRGQFRYEEKLAKASSIAREEFPYEVSAGSDQELMGAGGRMSHSPLASTVNLKSNPPFPVQRPHSSQRTQKQETKLPAFSFGAETNPKPTATACPLGLWDPEARCASSASGFVGSGLRGNGDGRKGRPEQA